MVDFAGKHYKLDHMLSASGAKYSDKDQNMIWWSKGNAGFLMLNDEIIIHDCIEYQQTEIDSKTQL
jgi:membrane-bound inhibitor of C-type lysozyme